jgi:hypothetical protein
MADEQVEMKPTLGLTGLTMNAMALIAPGAFLWLTFVHSRNDGGDRAQHVAWHRAGSFAMCLATAVCYAEMAKLYPGTGSSYYFAEQSFLNHEKAWKYARISKFIVGWGSHLYYWVYPGVMVAVMGELCGYLVGTSLAQLHERLQPRHRVHGAGCGCVLVRRRLDRQSRREWFHFHQHRHQCDSDFRATGFLGHGFQLSHATIRREASLISSIQRPARPTPTNSPPRQWIKWTPLCETPTACRNRNSMRPANPFRIASVIRRRTTKATSSRILARVRWWAFTTWAGCSYRPRWRS